MEQKRLNLLLKAIKTILDSASRRTTRLPEVGADDVPHEDFIYHVGTDRRAEALQGPSNGG